MKKLKFYTEFVLMDIDGSRIADSVNVKKDCIRLSARTTTLILRKAVHIIAINGDALELMD